MSFAVAHMQKIKSPALKGMQFHHQRERESKTNPDIDEERSKENYDLANDKDIDFNARVKEIIESQKVGTRKTRKDAVLVNELMVTSDKDFFDGMDPAERDRFFQESYKLFSERYGKQNIAYAKVHLDEKTPHMHLGVVPMRDGKLQGKNVFNRQELLWLQDKFPEHLQKLGFDLERGEKGSDREHVEMTKFKRQTLEKEIGSLEKDLKSKKNELAAFNEKVEVDVKVPAKRQMKNVEVPTGEKTIFGREKTKTEKKPTKNVILTESDYKRLMSVVKDSEQLKGTLDNVLKTDIAKVNMELGKENKVLSRDLHTQTKENKDLRVENMELKRQNSKLNAHISDLRRDMRLVYESTKDFLKERTDGLKAFKSVFKGFVDKVRDKTMDFQDKHNISLERNEFEKVHAKESRKERDRGMER
jgi:hypothetical protein